MVKPELELVNESSGLVNCGVRQVNDGSRLAKPESFLVKGRKPLSKSDGFLIEFVFDLVKARRPLVN